MLMMLKYLELTRNPTCHVVVLPFHPVEFDGLIQCRNDHISNDVVEKLVPWTLNVLMIRKYDADAATLTSALSKRLYNLAKQIPRELLIQMKQEMLE